MSEEFSAGVRIVLERAKSSPEDMMEEHGKWQRLREAVFHYKETGRRDDWTRGLRDDEIDALYDVFCGGYRTLFDEWVMKQVLVEEPKSELTANPRPFKTRLQGATLAGTWGNVSNQISNTSIEKLVHEVTQGRK
jgi:hypothetical protein